MKDAWKALREQAKVYLPAAAAALIGYIIAKVRQQTVRIQKETPPTAPHPRRAKRNRRR